MDYKEKYEKAVQAAILAKQNTESAVTIQILEDIFPELAESEDEKIRRNIIAALKGEGYYDCDLTNECIAWLEKQGEQTPAWSEEDELWIDRACMLLNELNDLSHLTLAKIPSNVNEIIQRLKSLKPQNTWKPTTEQLTELRCVISGCSFETSILVELEEDLKKLL